MIPQDETEELLLSRLMELGHKVRRPARLMKIDATADRTRVLCEEQDNALEIECQMVVGADGENSAVRTAAGIGFPGDTYGVLSPRGRTDGLANTKRRGDAVLLSRRHPCRRAYVQRSLPRGGTT